MSIFAVQPTLNIDEERVDSKNENDRAHDDKVKRALNPNII